MNRKKWPFSLEGLRIFVRVGSNVRLHDVFLGRVECEAAVGSNVRSVPPNRNRWFTVLNSMVDLSMANCQ